MLSKLILIKSCTYDLAEIDFTRGASMQLVGGNNAGKSSLIYALNFLFVVNRNHMIFNGGRRADKATMQHYFKEAEGSFIVFEVSKRGRKYCIVVWRDGEGNPRYGKLSVAYSRGLFFAQGEGRKLHPLRLADLRGRWLKQGAAFTEFKQNKEVIDTVYQVGGANDAVVWLQKSTHGSVADEFSRLYRYLMNTRLIDMNALREILLLADHREDKGISYSGSDLTDIDTLRERNRRVELLRKQDEAFSNFKQAHAELGSLEASTGRLASQFRYHCTCVRADLLTARSRQEQEKRDTEAALEKVRQKSDATRQERGEKVAERRTAKVNLDNAGVRIARIKELPTADFLTESLSNVEAQATTLSLQLADLERSRDSVADIERRIATRKRAIADLEGQLRNQDNWLIYRLAQHDDDRRRLGTILRENVLRADASYVTQSVKATTDQVRIFDGAFSLPPGIDTPALPTPEKLEADIAELNQRLVRDEELLTTARNYKMVEGQLKEQQAKARILHEQLRVLKTLPEEEQKRQETEQRIRELDAILIRIDKELAEVEEQEKRQREALDILKEQASKRIQRQQQLEGMLRKVESYTIVAESAYKPTESVPLEPEKLFHQLETVYRGYQDLQRSVEREFSDLRREFESELADPDAFITEIEQEFTGLTDLRESIDRLVDNIGQRFANPAATLLTEYQKFTDFINQKFNRNLAKVQVSNIEKLRIELVTDERLKNDLKSISELDLGGGNLFRSESRNLSILQDYIRAGKDIPFSNLFTLKLKLTVGGKEKTVDLGKQVESDGTDRMLRLVIVMQVISRLVKLSPENRIVMFIDEVATLDGRNRPQLVRFCEENHFYPIFAAPEPVNGFDRYVMITAAPGGRVVVEQDKHYLDAERN